MQVDEPGQRGAMQAVAHEFMTRRVFWITGLGNSMRPLFRSGDIIPIDPAAGPYRRGDMVLYGSADQAAIHRLLETDRNGWWVADDAGLLDPHFVSADSIHGRVARFEPLQGKTGLIYHRIVRSLFLTGRRLKQLLPCRP